MRVIHVHGIAAMRRLFGFDIESADQVAYIGQRILHQQRQPILKRRLFFCGRVLCLGPLSLLLTFLVIIRRYILEWALRRELGENAKVEALEACRLVFMLLLDLCAKTERKNPSSATSLSFSLSPSMFRID
jgi:hypothetical protein